MKIKPTLISMSALIMLCACGGSTPKEPMSDFKKMNLKGDVEIVQNLIQDTKYKSAEYHFNENGFITEVYEMACSFAVPHHKTGRVEIYQYDTDNKTLLGKSKYADSKSAQSGSGLHERAGMIEIKCDSDGNIVRQKEYVMVDGKKELGRDIEYKYSNGGKSIEVSDTEYNHRKKRLKGEEDQQTTKKFITLNSYGDPVEIETHYGNGYSFGTAQYEYEYDDKGNWIMKSDNGGKLVTYRNIKYRTDNNIESSQQTTQQPAASADDAPDDFDQFLKYFNNAANQTQLIRFPIQGYIVNEQNSEGSWLDVEKEFDAESWVTVKIATNKSESDGWWEIKKSENKVAIQYDFDRGCNADVEFEEIDGKWKLTKYVVACY